MVKIRLKRKDSYVEEPILWNNKFPYYTIPIFVGKKRKHVMDLISALELRGPSTTTEIANFVIESHYSKGQIQELGKYFKKRRAHYYWNHLYGYEKKTSGKKKIGTYDGLLEKGYVKIIETKKEKIRVYFPTLKGHLVSLGYEYKDDEIQAFIKNASINSLYFAFLYDISNKISLGFVKILFLEPIKKMIEQNRIRFDDDYRLNFDNIASATGLKINQIIRSSWKEINSYDVKTDTYLIRSKQKLLKQLDILIKNTWFNLQYDSKWEEQMVELYYPSDKQEIFYSKHSDLSDIDLLYKVMREIHTSYYASYRVKIPSKYTQKFPIPIRRKKRKYQKTLEK